ncbi:MAG: membrane protein insertase YidC [Armatimonadetes bacterium]|nr:membrane protein insertase YidC [Armatimonadota bacterium]
MRRTVSIGAAVASVLLVFMASQSGRADTAVDSQLASIQRSISEAAAKPDKPRRKALDDLNTKLQSIVKANSADTVVTHHAQLLQAEILEKRDKDPVSGSQHQAAVAYRRLVVTAGPGAMQGHPHDGWPDEYVQQAYEQYKLSATRIDKANQSKLEYRFLDFLVSLTGRNKHYSYWLAIFAVTLLVKLIITPLSHMQFESMRNMQRLQPKLEKLRKELEDDPREFQKQQWQLFKDYNANPLMGCLPLLVQLPFLMLLYRMIRVYEFQFAKGDFLWIGSALSMKVPGIGASLADPDWILLVLYGVSMYISTKMSSAATVDKAQADQQKMMAFLMPVMLLFFFKDFESAFILYWLVLNILTTTQQYFMLNKPVPALALEDEEPVITPVQATAAVAATKGPRPRKRK